MPADFAVTIDATNSPVADGEALDVDYTVENVGDASGTQDITLDINEELVTVIDDFEDYADDSDFASTWVTPGASTPWTLETSSPIEGSQSIGPTASNARVTYPNYTTVDDQPYAILFRRDSSLAGDPGFYIHTQDENNPFDDQIWCRLATDADDIELYIREGGAYVESVTAALSESVSPGTTYRLQIEASTGNSGYGTNAYGPDEYGDTSSGSSEVIATAFNDDTDTQIGQVTCPYSTSWSSGMVGMYGDEEAGEEFFDYIYEP